MDHGHIPTFTASTHASMRASAHSASQIFPHIIFISLKLFRIYLTVSNTHWEFQCAESTMSISAHACMSCLYCSFVPTHTAAATLSLP